MAQYFVCGPATASLVLTAESSCPRGAAWLETVPSQPQGLLRLVLGSSVRVAWQRFLAFGAHTTHQSEMGWNWARKNPVICLGLHHLTLKGS